MTSEGAVARLCDISVISSKGRMWACFLFVMLITLLLTGCSPEQTELTGKTMGTTYSIKYIASANAPSSTIIHAEIEKRLVDVNNQMSTYLPQSELSRFNKSREANVPFTVSPALATVVAEAIRLNAITEGALDVTVGPLVNLWGFGPEKKPVDQVPDEAELNARRALVGIDKLEVQGNSLIKRTPELYVDLSSIAKGYGVDVVAEYLISLGIHDYMVDIGGEVRTSGKNAKDIVWRIAIEKPIEGSEQTGQAVISLKDIAMATSGSYRNYFEVDGKRYSHTIDPKTGHPITHNLVSISVIAPTCMEADGLATGLDVLGPERALAVANRLQIPIYLIIKTPDGFQALSSEAFNPYLSEKASK